MKNIWQKSVLIFCFLLIATPLALAQKVIVNDTIAGYSASLQTSYGTANADLIFRIKKPDGNVVEIPEQSNEVGVAKTDFLGFHTKKAGNYEVLVYPEESDYVHAQISTFQVYADELSEVSSKISADPSALAADGREKALIKISLLDKYENPIANHQVMLVSSRSTDEIQSVAEETSNEQGNVFFYVSAQEVGISHLSAIDKTTGKLLQDRVKLVFFEPDIPDSNGGNLYEANIFSGDLTGETSSVIASVDSDFGVIDHFQIDFNNQVQVGSDQNYLTIIAQDAEGKVVQNYTGTVIISTPDDKNAILPGDGQYAFQDRDLGQRTFDLALIFSKTGKQTIQVYDFDPETGEISNFVKGEKVIEVVDKNALPDHSTNTGVVEIKKPEEGAKFGNSTLTVMGKGNPNTDLKIFVDDIKLDTAEVDSDGFFTVQLKNISDGQHTIFAKEVEGDEESSTIINFVVNTLAPTLDEILISPEGGVRVGENFTVTVHSVPNLSEASFTAAGSNEVLTEDSTEKGVYRTTMKAPDNVGEHQITIVLSNELGNVGRFANAGILKIMPVEKIPDPVVDNFALNYVEQGLKVSWDNIQNVPNETAALRLYYGQSEYALAEHKDLTLFDRSVVLNNLNSGTTYYFALALMDSAGNNIWQSAAISSENLHNAAEDFVATAGNGKVMLRWVNGGVSAYQLTINVAGTNYSENRMVAGNSTVVSDLINGQEYNFRLVAEGSQVTYPLVSATPTWDGTHSVVPEPIVQNYNPPQNEPTGPLAGKFAFAFALGLLAIFFFKKSFNIWYQ